MCRDILGRAGSSHFRKDCVINRLVLQEHGLDFQRLLDTSTYKETYRRDMISWGEEKRQADPGFFCRKIVEGVSQPIWVRGLCLGVQKGSSQPSPGAISHPHCHLLPTSLASHKSSSDVSCLCGPSLDRSQGDFIKASHTALA